MLSTPNLWNSRMAASVLKIRGGIIPRIPKGDPKLRITQLVQNPTSSPSFSGIPSLNLGSFFWMSSCIVPCLRKTKT